jgi:cystathionine beta-lyase/cystathionine gamma-synthase
MAKKPAGVTKRQTGKFGFSTACIHTGQEPDPSTGAIVVPIFATSTYVQEEVGKNKGYEYARVSNPTRTQLEINLAALESSSSAHVFASGMAAVTAGTQCFL